MDTPNTDPPPTYPVYEHPEYNAPVQPELHSNFNQPVKPQCASKFNQSPFNQPLQPQCANSFNQRNFNKPVQPKSASNVRQDHQLAYPQWANSFNQPSHLQGAFSDPPGNVQFVPGNNVVVTTQPMVFMAPMQCQIPDYQVYSVFTMVLCCFPIGLVACVFSRKTKEAIRNKNTARPHECSREALIFNNVALVLGIIIAVAYISGVIYYSISQSYTSGSSYNHQCYSFIYNYYYYC